MNRRDAIKNLSIGTGIMVGSSIPTISNATTVENKVEQKTINTSSKTRVIVCGGGFGGLTAAKYLKQFNPQLEILLIEKNTHFVSCPYSNVWLGGIDNVSLDDLSFDYLSSSTKYGYEYINETISDINRQKQTVTTNDKIYKYDYLMLSPGIDYDYTKLFKDPIKAKKVYTLYPPAMKPGSEHLLLKKKVENFKGGNFIITVPSDIYRCPPAPYERACMVAYYFKKNNIDGKVILIDPREKPGAKPEGFLSSFNELYKEYIQYLPMTEIKDIDFENKILKIDKFDKLKLDYVSSDISFEDANIIPNMKPAKLINIADLEITPEGWTKLIIPGFETTTDKKVYVVGDAGGHPYPKSGHMANSCAYVAAKQLAYKTINKKFDITSELPGNICYSMVGADPKEGISVSHEVSYTKKDGLKVTSNSTAKRDRYTGDMISQWYKAVTSDMF